MAIAAWLGLACAAPVHAASTVVALDASNTFGKGGARNQAYPAQLETLLRAKGTSARVVNAGINGDTTAGMLARLDRAAPAGTGLVILQPGGNDKREGSGADRSQNIAAIQSRLGSRGVKVILMENSTFRGLPHQPDGQHLTPDGYRMLAESILGQVQSAIGR